MIKRCLSIATLAAMLVLGYSRMSSAQQPSDIVGTWIFHVTITGASPCECIQIATLHVDSSLEGPGTDQFTGPARGVWAKSGANKVNLTFVQNSFNHDGTAAGLYTISGTMNLTGPGSGSGTSNYTLTNNSGATLAAGKATFTAARLKLAP
jgi:hypothetical protein